MLRSGNSTLAGYSLFSIALGPAAFSATAIQVDMKLGLQDYLAAADYAACYGALFEASAVDPTTTPRLGNAGMLTSTGSQVSSNTQAAQRVYDSTFVLSAYSSSVKAGAGSCISSQGEVSGSAYGYPPMRDRTLSFYWNKGSAITNASIDVIITQMGTNNSRVMVDITATYFCSATAGHLIDESATKFAGATQYSSSGGSSLADVNITKIAGNAVTSANLPTQLVVIGPSTALTTTIPTTVTSGTLTNITNPCHVIVDSSAVTHNIIDSAPVIHTILDSGTLTTAPTVHTIVDSTPVVHTIVDSSSVVHTILDSGTLTGITNDVPVTTNTGVTLSVHDTVGGNVNVSALGGVAVSSSTGLPVAVLSGGATITSDPMHPVFVRGV